MKTLAFEHVTFRYAKQSFMFENISFKLELRHNNQGIVALMGASGSGKSTLLKLILGTLNPQAGKISTNPINPVISYLPQDAVLFEHLSPLQNARYFENIASHKKYFDSSLFDQLSVKLGMDEVFNTTKSVKELSGGQRQRLSLLRALSIKPDILLLDEPTNGLDSDVKIHFLQELRRIVLEQNILAVYVTHHKVEAELCADEVLYLHKNDSTQVQEIFQSTIKDFIISPPFLSAAKVFNYPNSNIVECYIEDHTIKTSSTALNPVFISIKADNVSFSHQEGFNFEIVSNNSVFAALKLDNRNVITLPASVIDENSEPKLLLTGQLNVFDSLGKYLKTIEVLNNRIVA